VLAEVLYPFFGGLIFFTFVFLMFQALRLADFMIVHGFPAIVIVKLATLMILSFLPISLPLSFLISVLVGFGRLSADSELVAMKSSGISLNRLAQPVVVVSIAIFIFSLLLNLNWVPWGERTFKELLVRAGNTKAVGSINAGTFTSGFFDMLVFADKVNPKTNEMKHVFIYDDRNEKNPFAVVAKTGRLVPVKSDSSLGASLVLRLYNGNIHQNNPNEGVYKRTDYKRYDIFLNIEEGEGGAAVKPKHLSLNELQSKIEKTKPESKFYRELDTEYWRRLTVALSPIIFVLIGIGFGTVRTRSVRASAALITFLVIISYWSLQLLATSVAHNGWIPPSVSMHFPNLILGLGGIVIFRRASW